MAAILFRPQSVNKVVSLAPIHQSIIILTYWVYIKKKVSKLFQIAVICLDYDEILAHVML